LASFVRHLISVFVVGNTADAYRGTHEPALVAISVVIAILAAFIALSISARIVAATSRRSRWAWTCAGAISMGGGIWSMHFVGMLAFSLPCGVRYNPFGTLLSMVPGILASGVALNIISGKTEPNFKRLIFGAVLMGAGIGAMHYSGMAAMEPDAVVRYDPWLVGLSVVVAVVLALISLSIRFRLPAHWASTRFAALLSATVMGLAVAGMHYTAMQASVFFPLFSVPSAGGALPATSMALLITTITVLIAALTLVGTFAGHQSELAAGLKAEVLRRKALEQLAESGRARLQAIFDAFADGIVTIDVQGRVQQWSAGAQRIFGYTPEQILGRDLTLLMTEPHRSRHSGYVASFLQTRAAKVIGIGRELTAVRKDGTEFPIELAVSEVRDGNEVFFTGILRDITERERAKAELVRAREEAEAANVAKSQFLATMSHEIRTPMNGVLGMANLLSSTDLNDRQRRLVENLLRSGRALLVLINDILDFAKIESGKFELSAIPFDPRELIADLTDLFSPQCTAKGIEFVHSVGEDVPLQLLGDAARLRQVLVNLVGNAIKFTEYGEIVVTLSLGRREPDSLELVFAIEDTGVGIPADQLPRIFESFYQVDGSMNRSRGGSGLGLAISKQLVELMGGTISAESEVGRGSCFTFTIHVRSPAELAAIARTRPEIVRPLRVLLADGHAASARVITAYLRNWGMDATAVSSVAEAQRIWEEATSSGAHFDVIILDVKGLGARAIKFGRDVRASASTRRAEIILLVGMEGYLVEIGLEGLDAAALLPKPIRPSDLFDALATLAAGGPRRGRIAKRPGDGAEDRPPNFAARILVAEDNVVNQEVAAGILEAMGCNVVIAPTGQAAVQLYVEEKKFDLILMDCEMPIMDGIEAARRIREIENASVRTPSTNGPTRTRLPMVALTAHALSEVREKCLQAGMDDFLVKPFDDLQMAQLLSRWLTQRTEAEPNDSGPPLVSAADNAMQQVIDETVIERIRALDRKGRASRLERVVSQFASIAPALVVTIREKSEEGDREALWRAAHSLKSSAGALGATILAKHCAEIEAVARNSDMEPAKPLIDTLDGDLADAVRCLQSLIGVGRELVEHEK
jgi:two-component system sensor histidine kinase/response regulator